MSRPGGVDGIDGIDRRYIEGWTITGLLSIPRTTERIVRIVFVGSTRFESDEDAFAFVQRRAAEGSEFHAECLAYVVAERVK